ncbi:hypothetical protein CHS0354_022433 [Potamilus streckersoni]|uniref:peptidylprolyl isomerase n=1 Tax=Potamilus streckersoni TaxID=2493646 RepID=A0AAE0SXQ7_9BIVA|nr:hypothetical protein CHS0354_022433 [Potamilus streckersoni]
MGVTIQELSKGDGATFPKPGQIVSIHYTGMFENGTKFDSSRDRGKPFKFQLGKDQVLKGWEEGLSKMSLGQRVRLICPPEVAYGKRGYPGVYPL